MKIRVSVSVILSCGIRANASNSACVSVACVVREKSSRKLSGALLGCRSSDV